MTTHTVEFFLPLGLKDQKGLFHRQGTMRAVTAEDELAIQELDSVRFNDRMRDLELLVRVLLNLGDYTKIDSELLEGLFEPDLVYLQMLFNRINQSYSSDLRFQCPSCGSHYSIDLSKAFQEEGANRGFRETMTFKLPHGSGLTPELGSKVKGEMRMAKCRDFISLHRDPRCQQNPSWFYVGLLTRCITKMDSLKSINNGVVTKLNPLDFAFLVDLFNEINNRSLSRMRQECTCGKVFETEMVLPGEV